MQLYLPVTGCGVGGAIGPGVRGPGAGEAGGGFFFLRLRGTGDAGTATDGVAGLFLEQIRLMMRSFDWPVGLVVRDPDC